MVFMGEQNEEQNSQVKKVPVDRLQEEGKRIGAKALPPGITKGPIEVEQYSDIILDQLFKSRD